MPRVALLVSLVAALVLPGRASADINDNTYLSQNSTAKNITLGTLLGVAVFSWSGYAVWQLKALDYRDDRAAMGSGQTICTTSEVGCARYRGLVAKEQDARDSANPYFIVGLASSLSLFVVQLVWPNDPPKRYAFAPTVTPISAGVLLQARF